MLHVQVYTKEPYILYRVGQFWHKFSLFGAIIIFTTALSADSVFSSMKQTGSRTSCQPTHDKEGKEFKQRCTGNFNTMVHSLII